MIKKSFKRIELSDDDVRNLIVGGLMNEGVIDDDDSYIIDAERFTIKSIK